MRITVLDFLRVFAFDTQAELMTFAQFIDDVFPAEPGKWP